MRARLNSMGPSVARHFQLDSAGTGHWHVGKHPDPRMQAACAERGIDISRQVARQFQPEDFARFDHIIVMDRDNLAAVEQQAPAKHKGRARLLSSYEPAGPMDVPDPYYGGEEGFDKCLDIIEDALDGFMAELQPEN